MTGEIKNQSSTIHRTRRRTRRNEAGLIIAGTLRITYTDERRETLPLNNPRRYLSPVSVTYRRGAYESQTVTA